MTGRSDRKKTGLHSENQPKVPATWALFQMCWYVFSDTLYFYTLALFEKEVAHFFLVPKFQIPLLCWVCSTYTNRLMIGHILFLTNSVPSAWYTWHQRHIKENVKVPQLKAGCLLHVESNHRWLTTQTKNRTGRGGGRPSGTVEDYSKLYHSEGNAADWRWWDDDDDVEQSLDHG